MSAPPVEPTTSAPALTGRLVIFDIDDTLNST
jgi:hypothetical protein